MRTIILRNLLEIRQNYWLVPAAFSLLGVVLGLAMPLLDAAIGEDWLRAVPFLSPMEAPGARALLATLATAILGVVGVSYSVTIVAVSFASGNFGPRLIGNFMRDRLNQTVLGGFLATFVYAIVLLRSVQDGLGDAAAFVPQISILLALFFTFVSVGALIVFFHHVPETIDIMNLAAEVGEELRESVIAMLERQDRRQSLTQEKDVEVEAACSRLVRVEHAGYIQNLQIGRMEEIATKEGLTISVLRAPGDFVATLDAIFEVRPGEALSDKGEAALLRSVALGRRRTGTQDLLFLIDQLVEMVGRALSPSVNDPYTATICIDWMRAGLSAFARRPEMGPPDKGPVAYQEVTFEQAIHRAFGRSRQYISTDRTTTLHAIEALADFALIASTQARADLLREEMRTLARSAGEQLTESAAREEITETLSRALARVAHERALREP